MKQYNGVNSISFINADTGYAVGENWAIRKTENRGVTWWASAPVYSDWGLNLLEGGVGFASGGALRVYKTSNGYDNWKKLFIADNFSDVFFVNEQKGFAISPTYEDGKLYSTSNSGISWEVVSSAPGGNDILFIDNQTGFIGGSNLFKTTDGGESWYQVNGVLGGVGKIFFINQTIGWATSGRSILKTTDGGENWFVQITLPSDSYTSIFFVDSLNGWATSRYIWQTTNGGMSWIQRSDIASFMSSDVYFINEKGYIISNFDQKLYKSTNNGINWDVQLSSPYFIKNFGWLSDKHGLIMGGSIVYETNDSGGTWSLVSELSNIGLQKFHAPYNYLGYSTGNLGLIYKYIDTSIVPVELISFQGMVENKKVILTWQTASELNNSGFQVEKSFDKENWFNIGFVEGSGTTTEKINYIFIDNNIVTNIQYYRLKQVDHDGQYKFSDIIKIIGNSLITTFQLYPGYPNPFNSSTVISYQVPHRSFISISLYNVVGEKIIEIVNEEKSEGLYKELFQSSLLPSGVYFVRMTTSSGFNAVNKITLIK